MLPILHNLEFHICYLNQVSVNIWDGVLRFYIDILLVLINLNEHLGESKVFNSLTVGIVDDKFFTKVAEDSTTQSEGLCNDEWNLVCSAVLRNLLWSKLQ